MKKMDINKIVSEIIPPDNFQHRNGFSNKHLIDNLSVKYKIEVENALINKLWEKSDMLIVETLGYMKSEKSLPVLYELLENINDGMAKIITAVAIFDINKDQKMVGEAKTSFKNIKDKYQLITAFHYLVKFQDSKISKLIMEYTTDPDYLISFNAKQVLEK